LTFLFNSTSNHCMGTAKLDELRVAYKQAVDQWVNAIRAEEAEATPNHSEIAWEKWDAAGFAEQELRGKADDAKDAYKDALRQADLGF
jgi:hypothetical protein